MIFIFFLVEYIDVDFTLWLSWLLMPLLITFLLPLVIVVLLYLTALILYMYKLHRLVFILSSCISNKFYIIILFYIILIYLIELH